MINQQWMKDIADKLGTKHSDLLAVIRSGKKGAKKRTVKRNRHIEKSNLRNDS